MLLEGMPAGNHLRYIGTVMHLVHASVPQSL